MTDKIYDSSNYWLPENWNFKLKTLKTIDNCWRQLIEINVYEKKVESATTNENKLKKNTKSGQIIKLDESCTVSEVNEPVKVHVRGRPKGATSNTIGLRKTNRQVMPFVLKSNYLQAIDLLNWLQLPQKMVDNVLRNEYIIKSEDISKVCTSKKLEDRFMNESVNLNILECYFDEESFQTLIQSVEDKKNSNVGHCNCCNGTVLMSGDLKVIC